MTQLSQKQLAYLKNKIQFYFDKYAIDTEFRKDQFHPLSGQYGRLSWYIDGMEVNLSIRLFDDGTHTITRSTPESATETDRLPTPDDMQQLVVQVANYNDQVKHLAAPYQVVNPRYAHLTVEQLESEYKIYSEIIQSRHARGLEAKSEKQTLSGLSNELLLRSC